MIQEEDHESLANKNFPLGFDHRVKVMLSNNECFKQRNLSDANFQKFHLYTDTELGIDSTIFDKNLVDSVSGNICLNCKALWWGLWHWQWDSKEDYRCMWERHQGAR